MWGKLCAVQLAGQHKETCLEQGLARLPVPREPDSAVGQGAVSLIDDFIF